jgi:hypothetical protein
MRIVFIWPSIFSGKVMDVNRILDDTPASLETAPEVTVYRGEQGGTIP